MLRWIVRILESAGYGGIVILMVVENIFPPIPSEVILPLAGFTAARGQLSLPGVIIAGTLGSMIGAVSLYYLGKRFGVMRLQEFADRHGTWLAISGKDVTNAMRWFHRHGVTIILIGRMIPGVRSLISIPAGVCGMPLPQFLLYSAIGTAIWTTVLAYLGSLLGENYHVVADYVGPISTVIFAAIIGAFGIHVIRRKWHGPPPDTQKSAENPTTAQAGAASSLQTESSSTQDTIESQHAP